LKDKDSNQFRSLGQKLDLIHEMLNKYGIQSEDSKKQLKTFKTDGISILAQYLYLILQGKIKTGKNTQLMGDEILQVNSPNMVCNLFKSLDQEFSIDADLSLDCHNSSNFMPLNELKSQYLKVCNKI